MTIFLISAVLGIKHQLPASLTPTHNLPVRHLDVFKVLQVLMGVESF